MKIGQNGIRATYFFVSILGQPPSGLLIIPYYHSRSSAARTDYPGDQDKYPVLIVQESDYSNPSRVA